MIQIGNLMEVRCYKFPQIGNLMEVNRGISGMRKKCLISSISVLAFLYVKIDEEDSNS